MDTTIRQLPLLEALAASTRTTSILDLIRDASLAPNDIEVVGRLVSFLASPARVSCPERWADESPVSANLARIGQAAWANPDLLRAIRPVGESELAKKQLHGKVRDAYLVAMAAARRVTRLTRPDDAVFIEHLRLLAVVRALEASLAGIPREVHLEATCIALRQASEMEFRNCQEITFTT